MKHFPYLMLFLWSCTTVNAKKETDEQLEEREFQGLIKQMQESNRTTMEATKSAEENQSQMVKQTAQKIIQLKEENKDLKAELNETKSILDSVRVDTFDFKLLPISQNKDN